MSVFGYNTKGTDSDNDGTYGITMGKFLMSGAGTASKFTIALWETMSVAGSHVKPLCYKADGAGGIPSTLIAVGAEITVPSASDTWFDSIASFSLLDGIYYWLGYVCDNAGGAHVDMRATTTGGTAGWADADATFYATPANPIGKAWTTDGVKLESIYVTYTVPAYAGITVTRPVS